MSEENDSIILTVGDRVECVKCFTYEQQIKVGDRGTVTKDSTNEKFRGNSVLVKFDGKKSRNYKDGSFYFQTEFLKPISKNAVTLEEAEILTGRVINVGKDSFIISKVWQSSSDTYFSVERKGKAEIEFQPCGCSPEGNPIRWNKETRCVECSKCGAKYDSKQKWRPLRNLEEANQLIGKLMVNKDKSLCHLIEDAKETTNNIFIYYKDGCCNSSILFEEGWTIGNNPVGILEDYNKIL